MIEYRFELAVVDLKRSAAFYETLFAQTPVTAMPDCVEFSLTSPPLVVALIRAEGAIPPLASPGFRLLDREAVTAVRDRLERAGISTQTQQCAHCGYNEQFKVHVRDPDGHYWHFYAVERVRHPNEVHRCLEGEEAKLDWESTAAVRSPLDLATANELFRTLEPWDSVRVAGGTDSDRENLWSAGFRGVERIGDDAMAHKPDRAGGAKVRQVIYKGPRREFRDDSGNVFRRGCRTRIDETAWILLRRGSNSSHFLFLYPYPNAPARPDLAHLE